MKTKILLLISLILLAMPMQVQGQDPVSNLLTWMNGLRADLGLHSYTLNNALSSAAQNQATWMSNSGQISHTQSDGSSVKDRAAAAGYGSTWVSENIYMGMGGVYATTSSAWEWWLNSPIHYQGITSTHYHDVGIAYAEGDQGIAFVMVFGNPSGAAPASQSSTNNNGDSNSSDASSQPSYVVGVDEVGNIMHEIQSGDDLGRIAIIYGYTWDDLEYIRQINNRTDQQDRLLVVGEILLIPPQSGTYTPSPDGLSPNAEVTAEVESGPTEVVIPTATRPANITATPAMIITADSVPESLAFTVTPDMIITADSVPDYIVITVTPTVTSVNVANIQSTPNSDGGLIPPAAMEFVAVEEKDNMSTLLLVAITLQVLLLLVAGFELLRRSLKH
jgi:hypothetical protein